MKAPAAKLAVQLAAFAAARVYILRHSEVFTSFDSRGYRPVSLTGRAPRPWGVPAFYALFPDDFWRMAGQCALGTVAWALLAWALWALGRTAPAKWLLSLGTLGLGLMSAVTAWDSAMLSESLSLSLAVLSLALLLRWAKTNKPIWLGLAVPALVWWTFTRTDTLILAAFAAIGIVVFGRSRARWLAGLAGLAVAAGIGWSLAAVPVASQTFKDWSATGLPLTEETFLYRLRLEILPQPATRELFETRLGMPPCPGAQRVAAGDAWAIEEFAAEYRACPELKAWGERHQSSSAYWLVLASPRGYLESVARSAPAMLSGPNYGAPYAKAVPVVPGWLERAAFQPRGAVVAAVFGALVLVLIASRFSPGANTALMVTGWMLAAAGTASILVTPALSAGEYSRLGIQEAVLLRLAILLSASVVVDKRAGKALAQRDGVGVVLDRGDPLRPLENDVGHPGVGPPVAGIGVDPERGGAGV
jgi:hypothetical protein